jgi:hypothetical protein
VPTNDKLYGRLAAFTIMVDILGKGLHLKPRPLDPKVAGLAKKLISPRSKRGKPRVRPRAKARTWDRSPERSG